ncbi:MAG: hypothetical protein IKP73_18690 [Bacteroidales bacterium]|nr:hypothetical protein [Bacteroidales bacterium]MBR4327545.1 hypothetical protein [Bacteroidales bacterium]
MTKVLPADIFIKNNHYVIILDGTNDEKVIFEEYMRYLQHFCTYNGMCNSDDSDLLEAFVLLARKYIFSKCNVGNNVWIQKLEQYDILKDNPLFQFAICDIAMMTKNQKSAIKDLLAELPLGFKASDLKENTYAINEFYSKCKEILGNKVVDRNEIKKIVEKQKNNDVDTEVLQDYLGYKIEHKTNYNKKTMETFYKTFSCKEKDLKNYLNYLNNMLANRILNGNQIITQKLLDFKSKNNDYEVLYNTFGFPIIIDKDGTDNIKKFALKYFYYFGTYIL